MSTVPMYQVTDWRPITYERYVQELTNLFDQGDGSSLSVQTDFNEDLSDFEGNFHRHVFVTKAWYHRDTDPAIEDEPELLPRLMIIRRRWNEEAKADQVTCFIRTKDEWRLV